MQLPDTSRHYHSELPGLASSCAPAHSGPELASCVPDSRLAQDLARELLSEHFELARMESQPLAVGSSAMASGGVFTIGLARR